MEAKKGAGSFLSWSLGDTEAIPKPEPMTNDYKKKNKMHCFF
jgi:hypothetical protein